jgi:hypothetical protein
VTLGAGLLLLSSLTCYMALAEAVDMVYGMGGGKMLTVTF